MHKKYIVLYSIYWDSPLTLIEIMEKNSLISFMQNIKDYKKCFMFFSHPFRQIKIF